MTKKSNDTEGKGNLPEDKDKAQLNGEGTTSPTPPLKGDEPENSKSAEGNKNPEEEGADAKSSPDTATGAPAGEQASKQEEKAPSKNKEKDNADAPKTKPSAQQKKAADHAKDIVAMMDSNKVNVLFENTKGEYFTSENLAHLSEKGIRDKVKTIRRETLELLIKSVE